MWLARLRWRHRGAWLWPSFVALAVADGIILHALPPVGDSLALVGGIIIALFANLLAIVLLSRPLGMLLRRRRTDMPQTVAANYGGTAAIALVTAVMLIAGLSHHAALMADRSALREAIVRAEAYVGDRAPEPFRAMAAHTDTYAIQPGSIYRTCVPDPTLTRTYCVIVKVHLPPSQSVVFGGYESNAVFASGTN